MKFFDQEIFYEESAKHQKNDKFWLQLHFLLNNLA